jgi:hypothetical protein
MFPDFEDTGLIYHETTVENLEGIFFCGLVPRGNPDPEDRHDTIYDALYRHRPDCIPDWVDHRNCIFGYLNRKRHERDKVAGATASGAVLGLKAEKWITDRVWVGNTAFSDWVYCPKEAGYFDTPERERYFRRVIEPICAATYWHTSLSFEENLKIRHDHLLPTQGYIELLICVERVPPSLLSLQALAVTGSDGRATVLRDQCPDLFLQAESKLRDRYEPRAEFRLIAEQASRELR